MKKIKDRTIEEVDELRYKARALRHKATTLQAVFTILHEMIYDDYWNNEAEKKIQASVSKLMEKYNQQANEVENCAETGEFDGTPNCHSDEYKRAKEEHEDAEEAKRIAEGVDSYYEEVRDE